MNFLQEYDLLDNKHIPPIFKFSSRDHRLTLLAGLVDAHGHLRDNRYYEIIQKNETLADDIVFVARSCGFYVSIVPCQTTCANGVTNPATEPCFCISIYGRNLHKLPVLLKRKRIAPPPDHVGAIDESITEIEVEELGVGTYYGFQIDGNHRFLLGDFTVTHNTSFIENVMYYNKHKYPVARAFIGTESGYKRMCQILHPLYVSNAYDENEEKNYVLRQRTCKMEGHPHSLAINVLDDVTDDPAIFKSKLMRGMFKMGSRHWGHLVLIGTQYAMDFPPEVRGSTSYVVLFRNPEEEQRKKLYKMFGGIAGSYKGFCDLMDQLTGDYTCLIFKKLSQSNEIEDTVFWYKTKLLPEWRFGCKEYRRWGKKRYNKKYAEHILI